MYPIRTIYLVFLLCICSLVQGQDGDAGQSHASMVIEEVIVTAQKIGQQSSRDVPMSITALSDELINKYHLVGMDDYLRIQPGTNFIERGTARNSVIIRGITADPGRGGAIAGIYIDETPVQGLGFLGTGSPDLKLVDVERVEVLRGPQGTLYGAGSMSGTIRTLTRAPNTQAHEGFVKLGGAVTSGHGDFNNEIQAMVNLPLAKDQFALRAVVYRFENSGFIRNVALSDPAKIAGVNAFGARFSDRVGDRGNNTYEGFRVGALWRVNDQLDIRLTAMRQQIEQDGAPTTDAIHRPFEQSRYARRDGSDERLADDLRLYSLVVDYKANKWSLVSASSWVDYESGIDWDVGLFFKGLLGGVEPPIWLFQGNLSDKFTQELRWVWDADSRWRALVGAYYEHNSSAFIQTSRFEGDPALDPFGGFFNSDNRFEGDFKMISFFTDITFDLTDQLEITAGARTYDVKDGESGNTFKAGLNWRPETTIPGEDPLVYMVWSEGFRPGFAVGDPPDRCDPDGDGVIDELGLQFKDIESDDLESWELGYKTTFAQQRVALEVAAFDIDWAGIPINLPVPPPCAFTLPFNTGSAHSTGVEFSFSALLTERLQLDLTASWVNAELKEDSPGLGRKGDRLPGSPKHNATLGLEYDFLLVGHNSWVRGDIAWVGDYYSTLQESPPKLGDYTSFNLAAGAEFNQWSVELFVKNLTDSDELTWANPIWAPFPRGSVLRPRTFGVRLGYVFSAN